MLSVYETYLKLFERYGLQHWWPADSAFEMMVGAILTQNTSWSNVECALKNLPKNLTPEFILTCPVEELGGLIRPSGYFQQKALRLKDLAGWFLRHDGNLEAIRQENPEKIRSELLALNGVGPETADSILLYAFEFPYLVIDAYTRRVLARLGFKLPAGYDEIRLYCENRLPYHVALFNEFHALIVRHAKEHCKTKPLCGGCPLFEECEAAQTGTA